MSNNLSSPSINKAIGKILLKKLLGDGLMPNDALGKTIDSVVMTLDCLGYLGVLQYSLFDPERLEESLE